MRQLLGIVLAASLAASIGARRQTTGRRGPDADPPATLLLDNARVRVYRMSGTARAGHQAAVVVPLEDGPTWKAGEAYWSADGEVVTGPFIVVEPKRSAPSAAPAESGSSPGQAQFVGMSFTTLFENDRVAVIRARMEVGAREGVHTHASDIVVVHLSGGEIEDTANGTTRVNRWQHGDVEFEARGFRHSARNVGQAIDVVLVTLKP